MDRNERHFQHFYTPRRLKQKWRDKENRLGRDPPSSSLDFPPAPQTTPGKGSSISFTPTSLWVPANPCHVQVQQGDENDLSVRPRLFQSPPDQSLNVEPSSLTAPNNNTGTLTFTTPPLGSSKLLRMHRSASRQHIQRNIQSGASSTHPNGPWASSTPAPLTPRYTMSIGRSIMKRRLLDTGAKRVPVDATVTPYGAAIPFWKSPRRLPTAPITSSRQGYDGTTQTPSIQLLQSTNASRLQRVAKLFDNDVPDDDDDDDDDDDSKPTAREIVGPTAPTSDDDHVGQLNSKLSLLTMPATAEMLESQQNEPHHFSSPESTARLQQGNAATRYSPSQTANNKTCDTPSSRGSLESFWDSLPMCHSGGSTPPRIDGDETHESRDTDNGNSFTPQLRWECVRNPVALTLWNEEARDPNGSDNGMTMENDYEDECNISVESTASSVQLNSFVMDPPEHLQCQNFKQRQEGKRTDILPGTAPHEELSLNTPQSTRIHHEFSMDTIPAGLPSPPKVTSNWLDHYGRGHSRTAHPRTAPAIQHTSFPALVRPIAILPSLSIFARGDLEPQQQHQQQYQSHQ